VSIRELPASEQREQAKRTWDPGRDGFADRIPVALPDRFATIMLLVVTMFWGLSFALNKNYLEAAKASNTPGGPTIAVLTMISVRMVGSLLIFAVFSPGLLRNSSLREHGIGFLLGLIQFVGFVPQTLGINQTSPALSGFITSLSCAWIPVLAFLCFRVRPQRSTMIGLAIGVVGAMVLGIQATDGWSFDAGARLNLVASVIFAFEIVLIDRLGRTVRPGHLTVGFLAGNAIPAVIGLLLIAGIGPGLSAWMSWAANRAADGWVVLDLALLTVFCTVLSSHWLIKYQPRVPADRVALIYLIEPLFATAFAVLWGHDRLTLRLLAGGALILGGNLLVELPAWWRARFKGPDRLLADAKAIRDSVDVIEPARD
jgi:drug/metabolite transporter (DMT)-like permease